MSLCSRGCRKTARKPNEKCNYLKVCCVLKAALSKFMATAVAETHYKRLKDPDTPLDDPAATGNGAIEKFRDCVCNKPKLSKNGFKHA